MLAFWAVFKPQGAEITKLQIIHQNLEKLVETYENGHAKKPL